MTTENQSNKKLKYVASDFKSWNKETEKEEPSNIVDSVYINEVVSPKTGKTFLAIDIKTKDNRNHKNILSEPMSDEQKQINEKLRAMSPERQKELLKKLE